MGTIEIVSLICIAALLGVAVGLTWATARAVRVQVPLDIGLPPTPRPVWHGGRSPFAPKPKRRPAPVTAEHVERWKREPADELPPVAPPSERLDRLKHWPRDPASLPPIDWGRS